LFLKTCISDLLEIFNPPILRSRSARSQLAAEVAMKGCDFQSGRQRWLLGLVVVLVTMQLIPVLAYAQNLGSTPQLNRAVQGQNAAQPEGALLNLVNWVGNVVAPLGAALCVVMAVISYAHGRGVARWAVAALGLLLISGLTRLLEFWINSGQAGVQ
jgi:hypothetical protein